jgi:hypothetical protein
MLFKNPLEDIFSWEHHFFSVYLLLFIFITYAIYFILKHFNSKIYFVIFLLIFSTHFIFNFQLNNKSNLKFAKEETLKLFNNIEKDAIVITTNLEIRKLINYFQLVEKKRKDITVLGTSDFSNPVFLKLIMKGEIFFDDVIPVLNRQEVSVNIDMFIKSIKIKPLYCLIPAKCNNIEEEILYNQLLNYNNKIITTFVEFKGEEIPSSFIYNLIKIER